MTKLESILTALSIPGTLDLNAYDLLVYGGGGQSRSYYNNLNKDPEVEILWTGWSGSKWTSFLSFIPGQAGLLKVFKQSRLKPLYEELASHSVSDLYYVPKALTEKIKQAVISGPSSHDSKMILRNERDFFYLQSEMDQTAIINGEACYFFDIAIGQKLPEEVKAVFSVISN